MKTGSLLKLLSLMGNNYYGGRGGLSPFSYYDDHLQHCFNLARKGSFKGGIKGGMMEGHSGATYLSHP